MVRFVEVGISIRCRKFIGEEKESENTHHAEVETTVNDDTNDRGNETAVETSDTVRGEGLAVDIDETVELALTAALGSRLGVVGKTSTGVVKRVNEEERRGTSGTTGGKVSTELYRK